MKKVVFYIFFLGLFVAGSLRADIYQSSNLLPVEQAIEESDSDTLIIFDVNDTLITCDEPLFHDKNKKTFGQVSDEYFKDLSKERIDELMTTILSSRKTSLVDQKVLDIVDLVKNKQLRMVVLTSCGTGKYGLIEKMEDWRIRQLEDLGLSFSDSHFEKEKWFDSMKGPHGVPLLKNGVIFTAQIDKSIVLDEFVKEEKVPLKKIIYVDDQVENLKDVEAYCRAKGIEFIGFEYTAVKDKPVQKIDEKLIEIQLNVLLNEGQWITSEEAAESFNDAQE